MNTQSSAPARANQTVSKEEVRLLAIEIGVREAARKLGLSEDRVRQWSSRFQWFAKPADTQNAIVTTVTKTGDVLASELAEHERETRISLARSARRMAKDCEELPVKHADLAKTVAQTMAIVHRQDEGKAQGFTLNVLNMGSLDVQIAED